MSKSACQSCGWVHPSDAAMVVGSRFISGVRRGYASSAEDHSPVRKTRAEAEDDYCRSMKIRGSRISGYSEYRV